MGCGKFSGDTPAMNVPACAHVMVMSLIIWTCLYLLKAKQWMMNNAMQRLALAIQVGNIVKWIILENGAAAMQCKWLIWQRDKSNKCFHFECARWDSAHCLFIGVECILLCINAYSKVKHPSCEQTQTPICKCVTMDCEWDLLTLSRDFYQAPLPFTFNYETRLIISFFPWLNNFKQRK